MRTVLFLSLAAIALAQVPAEDVRNTNTPNTDTHFTMPEYQTLEQWQARRDVLRKQILVSAGLYPLPEKTPLHAQVFGRITHADYTIEKVLLETMPGYWLGGNLYRPVKRSGKVPAVLTPHGHWQYGRLENQPEFSGPALGISLARQGYVAFAYDMVGWNDTTQTLHDFRGPAEQLWAFGPLGLQLWDSIRAVDFVESLEEVDAQRIGVTGASGGGTQTFLLAAVDDRVAAAAPVNMVSAIMQGGSPCENAPGLRVGTFNVEIASMFAPKPLLLVAATGDWTKNVPKEEYPAVRRIYELYGRGENVQTAQFNFEHNYNRTSREAVYRFFGRHLLGRDEEVKEANVEPEKLQDMLALHGRALPDGALAYEALFDQWKMRSRAQSEAIAGRNEKRERLALALGAEMPERVESETEGEKIVLARAGKGDRVPGLWIGGKGAPVLVVHEEGAEAARQTLEVKEYLAMGRPVLLIDAFQTGNAKAKRDRSHQFFLTFNRSDDAHRVQDILTALAFLGTKQSGTIELVGMGKAGVWCTFAAALARADLKLTAALDGFGGADKEFIDRFFVPGIQRAGGWKAALDLTEGKR